MRIRGSGSGFGFFGGGGGSRSDSFKQGRKSGQKVRGKLLKWVSDGMAWVEIDGHRLLAQLNSRHPEGTILTFLIKQLHPEIILKEVFGVGGIGTSVLSLASDFEAARTLFENEFRPHAAGMDTLPGPQRLDAFLALLEQGGKPLAAYLDATACIQAINSHLDNNSNGTLLYQPWLIPTARRHITLARPALGETVQSVTEFDLPSLGMVRMEFLYKQPEAGYRLKLQHVSKADELKRYLTTRKHPEVNAQIDCLGISKLPQSAHGGILAELMFQHRK